MKDLISREAVIERIKYEADICNSGITRGVLELLQTVVEGMPPAADAVEVVHGRWVNNTDDYPECNRCGYMPMYDPAIDDIAYSNYCPNCGADMRGESNE